MTELVLPLINYRYPFGEALDPSHEVKVEQIQVFNSMQDLHEKKNQIIKKNELINSSFLIRLQTVYQSDMKLHYVYEYVPFSIASFIKMKHSSQNKDIWEMTKKLTTKKVGYELTMLIGYLTKMKIEVDLCPQNLGINKEQKIKLYMNSRCKMGHKTQLSLIAFYGQCKDKILKYLQNELENPQKQEPLGKNFKRKQSNHIFQVKSQAKLTDSVIDLNSSRLTEMQRDKKAQQNYEREKLRSTMNRKMSSGHFQLGNRYDFKNNFERQGSPREAKSKKFSFQVHPNSQSQFNSNSSANQSYFSTSSSIDPDPILSHSKKIKIQLEQKQNVEGQKRRKDSYKVRVTTVRQYEVDNCNPQNLFQSNGTSEEDIFEYFAKRARREDQQKEREQKNNQEESFFNQSQNTAPSPPTSPLPQFSNLPLNKQKSTESSSAKTILQQKIRVAKQRAEKVLNQMKSYKKSI